MSISECQFVTMNKISDPRGNITFIESNRHIPFDIKRVYYLYDIPGGAERGGHAHKELKQLFIALSGSFDIHLDDGKEKKVVHLNRPNICFYMHNMVWREISNFSSGAVCFVLASDFYKESDYFRNYDDFIKALGQET